MKYQTALLVSLGIFVGGCSSYSNSSYNPANWGADEVVEQTLAPEEGYVTIEDLRELVPEITDMSVLNTNGGVIVHATGLPSTQGYHTVDLVPTNDEEPINGVLEYEFRVVQPFEVSRVSTPQSREIVVAHFISNAKLRNVREIRILAATNARSSRAQ